MSNAATTLAHRPNEHEVAEIERGAHGDPFSILGPHRREGGIALRIFRPGAEKAEAIDAAGTVLSSLEPIGDAVPVAIYAADDRTVIGGDLRDSGREYWGDHTLAGALRDIAWFRLEGHVINGGVMRGGHVEIPFIGAINGLSALVQAIYPDRRVAGRQGVNSVQPGHSGSPVYTLNPDRSANIIGIASGTAFGVLLAVDQLGPLPAGLR